MDCLVQNGGNFKAMGEDVKSGVFFNVENPGMNFFYEVRSRVFRNNEVGAPVVFKYSVYDGSGDLPPWEPNSNALLQLYTIHEENIFPGFQWVIISKKIQVPDLFLDLSLELPPLQVGIHARGTGPGNVYAVDRIELDCDPAEILFRPEIRLCSVEENNSCQDRNYCVSLSTDCTNVNYSEFSYHVEIHNVTNPFEILYVSESLSGQNSKFTLNNMPSGTYGCRIVYNTQNGKNLKVNQYFKDAFNLVIEHDANGEYVITEDKTINMPVNLAADIRVKSGAVLRVKDRIRFVPNAALIIEEGALVEVSGLGHLTSCQDKWPGVSIMQNGRIEVVQNGTISNAVTGITHNHQGNAFILCDGGHFEDNTISIHVYRKAQLSVHNTGFNGGIRGVILEYTEGHPATGTTFTGNSFAYMQEEGILAYSAPIVVRDGNEFYGCDQGLVVRNLFGSPVVSTVSGVQAPNEFTACRHGVYGNAGEFRVWNNFFNQNNYGNIFSGINTVLSFKNSFSGFGYGETFYDTQNVTISNENQYNTNGGLFAFGNNYNYTFQRNCFNTMYFDANTWGRINEFQGNADIAASNCFTGNNVPDMYCNTDHTVEYYIPKASTNPPACMIPATQGNYITKFSDNLVIPQCGVNNPNYVSEYDYIFTMGCDSSRLFTLIQQLRQLQLPLLVKIKQNTITLAERRTLNWVERHLRIANNQWEWCLRRRNQPQRLIQWYKEQDNTMEYRLQAVEALIEAKEYEDARNELDSIKLLFGLNNHIYQSLILSIETERTDSLKYTPNHQDIKILKSAAAVSDPYAAYARALLHKLTKEQVEPEINFPFEPRTRKDSKPDKIEQKVMLTPNPVSQILHLRISGFLVGAGYSVEIMNAIGQLNKININSEHEHLDISHLPAGIYYIKVKDNQGFSAVEKFIKI
jgi:hypothetical protein